MKYTIEIYAPDSTSDTIATFDATSAFIAINKGDILNPAFFQSYDKNPAKVLKVLNVEHIIWQHEGSKEPSQKICIFTTEENNDRKVRFA